MKNILKLLKKSSGFTLIELLVVIAIIGVLATVLLAAIDPLEQINKGNDGTVKSNVARLHTATMTNGVTNPVTGYVFPAPLPVSPWGAGSPYLTFLLGVGTTQTTAADVIVCGELRSKASGATAAQKVSFIACGNKKYVKLGNPATLCVANLAVCP